MGVADATYAIATIGDALPIGPSGLIPGIGVVAIAQAAIGGLYLPGQAGEVITGASPVVWTAAQSGGGR